MKLLQFIRKAFNWLTSPERFSLINGPLFKKENLGAPDKPCGVLCRC